ncbi:MAG: MBL fold metallo-hydrolase [Bacillales bacterium]|nr:MBL fold metallo-hydrolase [Bacillales bacterium]
MAKKKVSSGQCISFSIFGLLIGLIGGGTIAYVSQELPDSYIIPLKEEVNIKQPSFVGDDFTIETIKSKDFSIHFMELGNKYAGDATLIKAGTVEVLIDAGSKVSSIDVIADYVGQYIENGLDYIIVTHAHEDHYVGFATNTYEDSLFSKLNVGPETTLIDFSQITENKASNKMYKNYINNVDNAVSKGVKHYKCAELVNTDKNVISLNDNVIMKILKTKFYDAPSNTENNHSVCTLFTAGELNYLFTGDLEKEGEESLVYYNNDLPKVEVYKAGHHGSKTSSSELLMEKIQPKKVCVCCCAGSSEYTKTDVNQFPTQAFINNVAPYTDQIFVTTQCVDYDKGIYESMNGNIIICHNIIDKQSQTYCSNNTNILKETEWFKSHRSWPSNGV